MVWLGDVRGHSAWLRGRHLLHSRRSRRASFKGVGGGGEGDCQFRPDRFCPSPLPSNRFATASTAAKPAL